MPVGLVFVAFAVLCAAHGALSLSLYQRWRKVRFLNAEGLTINRSLLRAIENNQESLGDRVGWANRDSRVGWTILRLTWSGEHRMHNDPQLTRMVYAMRALSLLTLPVWFVVFVVFIAAAAN